MKRLIVGVLVFFVAQFVLAVLLGGMLGFGGFSIVTLLLSIGIAWFVASRVRPDSSSSAGKVDGFVSDYRHDNIAINSQTGKLWVRDRDGRSAVLDKADILRWNLAFTSLGVIHTQNRIEIHARDLNRPMWSIPFNRHGDTWKWNARKNYAEAEEWNSRLTTWLHS